ncbi:MULTISPECIES: M23 family metallopeptidase [unclassified Actinopolyspora]|uniref:M23 family metallopeptidase n=1 Tax=unclassified Actinopolyspora TaxID=2639451 RepID=UPI0013F67490|nr:MULTISPECIES: M23 family metallopeptidase [unclassified Actinopolyspora]NHD17038.1 peptidoglycan DD-metalloendopeptidase family protein [Actinopolyspora sp. BKK2]NHE76190.1 peptidoglycan DD-metalloendopeptidase family protein [Actinopolyspora sp. BKK1]
MADKHDEGGRDKFSTLKSRIPESLRNSFSSSGSNPVRNKILAGVVAAGAFVAVGSPLVAVSGEDGGGSQNRDVAPVAEQRPLSAAVNGTPESPESVKLPSGESDSDGGEKQNLDKSKQVRQQRAAEKAKQVEAERKAEQKKAVQQQAEKKRALAREAAQKEKAEQQNKADEQEKQPRAKAAPKAAEAPDPTPNKLVEQGFLTSGFHSRGGTHAGIDIGADTGTPIYAPQAGTVISSGSASGFGMWVRVQHDNGEVTVYGHIHSSQVSVGQQVEAGQQIATVGSRGQSTGPHLHFEVRVGPGAQELNPIPWLQQRGLGLG